MPIQAVKLEWHASSPAVKLEPPESGPAVKHERPEPGPAVKREPPEPGPAVKRERPEPDPAVKREPPESGPAVKRQRGVEVHAVFVLDQSASMKREDVKAPGGQIARSDAVFEAVGTLLEDQAKVACAAAVSCSLVLFNDTAKVVLCGSSLADAATRVRSVAQEATPRFGTKYGPALEAVDGLLRAVAAGTSIVVFLSDGRPGDHTAVSVTEDLVAKHACEVHTVGFGPETQLNADARCSLGAIAEAGNGRFFDNAKLDLGTLRSTFTVLSSSVTATRLTLSGPKRELREFKTEAADAWQDDSAVWDEFEAVQMLRKVDAAGKLRLVASKGTRTVRLHSKAFAVGAMRAAHHFFIKDGDEKHLVAKESRFKERYVDRLRVAQAFLEQHEEARACLEAFNAARGSAGPRFVEAFVYRLSDPGAPGGFRYLLAEEFIDAAFAKFNGNDGFVNPAAQASVAQAFSHWTLHRSCGASVVVDIQGAPELWTDPQTNSQQRCFGSGDLGADGIAAFSRTHVCNSHCAALGLPTLPAVKAEPAAVKRERPPVPLFAK